LVDIGVGINVNFIKSLGSANKKLPPISFCTDPSKLTKTLCASPETWYGGCEKAGYLNKSSCEAAPSVWHNCSDISKDASKVICEAASADWYGEGFGCSDQTKINKTTCISPAVWRNCTDNGTIQDEATCIDNNQIWYGTTDIYTIDTRPYQIKWICMQIFYRKADLTIGVLISDNDKTNDSPTVKYDAKNIVADGSFQTQRFQNFRDSISLNLVTSIPVGINAVAIYEATGGVCSTVPITAPYYPNDRTQPVQILFSPNTNLPAINW
jgi:hypothetical protein